VKRLGSKLKEGDKIYLPANRRHSFSDLSVIGEIEKLYIHEGVLCMKVRVLQTQTTRIVRVIKSLHYQLTEQFVAV
jgi:hypothetical protein